MMSDNYISVTKIKATICEIANSLINLKDEEFHADERTLLHIILSNSQVAISFISILEEEFTIEFDDEDINLDFFQSFDNIGLIIENKLK